MYHPEYQVMPFLSEQKFDVVNNKQTQEIFANIGQFFYQEAMRLRANNIAIQGKEENALHEADRWALLRTDINQLWGHIEPYIVSKSGIVIQAYAVPPFN